MGNDSIVTIQFNGQPMTVPAGTSIATLLQLAEIRSKLVAVEVNLDIIPHQQHQHHVVLDGDVIEAVTLVGGG